MATCIKCGKPSGHSICSDCAAKLEAEMTRKDRLAHAIIGIDATLGKTGLNALLNSYKEMSETDLEKLYLKRLREIEP